MAKIYKKLNEKLKQTSKGVMKYFCHNGTDGDAGISANGGVLELLEPIVLVFDKSTFVRDDIDSMTDTEKYETALLNGDKCKVYKASEYCDMINNHIPMDRYVLTYIVNCASHYSGEKRSVK